MRRGVLASAALLLCGVVAGVPCGGVVHAATVARSPRSTVVSLITHAHRIMLPCRSGFGVLVYDLSQYASGGLAASSLESQAQRVVAVCLQASLVAKRYAQSQPRWLRRYAVVRAYLRDAEQEMVDTQGAASTLRATIVFGTPTVFAPAEGAVFRAEAATGVAERALRRYFHLPH